MSAWFLPIAAAAFWAGLFSWEARPPWLEGWMPLVLALAAVAGAMFAAPSRRTRDPLATGGLVAPESPTLTALHADRPSVGGSPVGSLSLGVVAVLALGCMWGGVAEARREGSLLARLSPTSITVVGTLKTDPAPGDFGWSAVLDVTHVETSDGRAWSLRESVWLSGNDDAPRAVRGDLLRAEGSTEVPEDPGFSDALHRKGIAVAIRANELELIGGSPSLFVRATQSFRAFVGRTISRIFPPKEAGLLLGLVLGDDSRLDPGLARDFKATGLGHLLVVSGENVAMVLAPILALASGLRLTRWPRFALCLGVVAFFVVLTGAEPSVLRAGVMAALTLTGVLMGRPRSTASILAGAVLVLLVLDPWLIWSIGFQLSVGATAGMVALATALAARLERWVPRAVALAAGTTLAAQFGVTPILLFHFHEVPVVTVAANLAAFPFVEPALLIGIASSLLGLAWMPLGRVVAIGALVPMRGLELVADTLAKAPVPSITGGGPLVLVVGAAVFASVTVALRTGWRPPRSGVVLAVAVLPLLVWTSAVSKGPPAGLTVTFFDVGQGDSALIRSPAGATVLVDGGPDDELVSTDLAALGVKRLDVVVASHPHADHIVGLPTMLARWPVGLLIQPGCPETSELQAQLDRAIEEEGVPERNPRAGETFVVGDLRLDVLSPDRCWTGTESDTNNDALVIRVSLGGDVILLATEPEEPAQEALLERGVDLTADVLKVPHHGAATSVPEFFQAVHATEAIVSVGENTYGHPVPSTLEAIAETGAEIWRTDQHGSVTVTFTGGVPVVTAET